jgi:hypothetical protein
MVVAKSEPASRVVPQSTFAASSGNVWAPILILLVAFVVRLDFLFANAFVIDADEAIVGLMAQHIVQGEPVPTFYYGQHYMGSFESICAAILFKVFGPSSWALKTVPLFFSLIWVGLVFRLGCLLKDFSLGILMALPLAVSPQMLTIWSGMARGGYSEILCLGTWALIIAIQWARQSRKTIFPLLQLSFVLGFGFWVNNQIVFFILPLFLFVIATLLRDWTLPWAGRLRRFALYAAVGVLAFLIGGLPFWLYNVRLGFPSFGIASTVSLEEATQHFFNLLTVSAPILGGARRQWQFTDVWTGSSLLLAVIGASCLLAILAHRAREILRCLGGHFDYNFPAELLLGLLATIVLVFSLSSFGTLTESPRYLLPLYVPYAFLLAFGTQLFVQYFGRLGFVPFLLVLCIHLASNYAGGRALPGEPFVAKGERVSKNHDELNSWLLAQQIPLVRTNYWIGYRLAFETQEKVRFVQFREPYSPRIPRYEAELTTAEKDFLPLVLVPAQAEVVKLALLRQGIQFQEHLLSRYVVLFNLAPSQTQLRPYQGEMFVKTSELGTATDGAIDGNLNTRWGSARPQKDGMFFRVEFPSHPKLRAFTYDLGNFVHDQPLDLQVEVISASGVRRKLLGPGEYEALRFVRDRETSMTFYFEPQETIAIELKLLRGREVFDWSIAEFRAFQ